MPQSADFAMRLLKAVMPGTAGFPEDEPRPFATLPHRDLWPQVMSADFLQALQHRPNWQEEIGPLEDQDQFLHENPEIMEALLHEANLRYGENSVPTDWEPPRGDPTYASHPVSIEPVTFPENWQDIHTGEPMDLAMRLLKMPMVDTAAGIPVAYGEDMIGDERMEGSVGSAPFVYNRRDGPVDMTPNEYFDLLGAGSPDSEYRWRGREPTVRERNEKIASMIEALQSGAAMGAPRLAFGGAEDELWRQGQEGGHRMEALRQMGHGDTPIPVWRRYTS